MEIGKRYKIIIDDKRGGRLTFTAKIISENSDFITFKDIKNEVLSYNKNLIIYYKEVEGDEDGF